MNTALVSGISVVSAAGISAVFGWITHRGQVKAAQVGSLLAGYNEIVKNLQSEVHRLRDELESVRDEMKDCERRSYELRRELDEMRETMALIQGGTTKPPRKPAGAAKKTPARKTPARKRPAGKS